jgi:hypothetical protein
VIEVEQFYGHEEYDADTLINDIALAKLKTPIKSDAVNLRVRLPVPLIYTPTGY